MTYSEFKGELFKNILELEAVKGKLARLLERGYTSDDRKMQNIIKCINLTSQGRENTILQEDFIHVTWGEGNVMNMLYWNVRDYYEKFQQQGWAGVLPEIVSRLQMISNIDDMAYIELDGYEQVKSKLILRPIQYERNKYELEECIYWMHSDIALVLYQTVYESDTDYMTMKVLREMTGNWKISDDNLLTNALLNTFSQMPPRLYYATDLRQQHGFTDGVFMPDENGDSIKLHLDDEVEGALGYRLTTTRGINGAIALFYPGVQERLAELMDGDFLAGFTSIHEVMLHPVKYQSPGGMKETIQNINAIFELQETLTGKVFRYCRGRKELIEV